MKSSNILPALACLGLSLAAASAQTTYYWDTNGATAGFGTSPRNGTWGTDSFWTTSASGNITTVAWPGVVRPSAPDTARLDGGFGTITVSGTQTTAQIRATNNGGGGNYTLSSGTINLETANFGQGYRAGGTYGGDSGNTLTINSTTTLGADGGSGTREIELIAGSSSNAGGNNALVLNGGISAGSGARATTQRVQLRAMGANATQSATTSVTLNGVISNGSQTVALEYGSRSSAATSGTVTINSLNTYTGDTRIGSGTVVVNANSPSGAAGAFGNATSAVEVGFGNVAADGAINLLIGTGGVTIGRNLNVSPLTSSTTTHAVTLGGSNTSGIATFSGNIALGATTARTTAVSLTAASGGTVTFSGVLSNGAGGSSVPINKIGSGTVNLTAANTYSGGTTVSAGTLLVNNLTGSATGTGSVAVNSGAILGGNGTISGATSITGSLRPGNSIGQLNIANNVTWVSGDNWVFELGAVNTSDRLNITGDFLKGAGSTFTFDFAGSTDLGTFVLVDWSGSTGFTVPDFSYTNLGGGNTGTFQFNGSQLEFVAIPEPTTWALLAGSLTALVIFRRRRRA